MEALRKFVEENDILYAVFTDIEGKSWLEFGSRKMVPQQGSLNHYFPGPEAMPRLAHFLEGQILPQTIVQGDVRCIIGKPTKQAIFGLFIVATGDALARMERSEELNGKVLKILAGGLSKSKPNRRGSQTHKATKRRR